MMMTKRQGTAMRVLPKTALDKKLPDKKVEESSSDDESGSGGSTRGSSGDADKKDERDGSSSSGSVSTDRESPVSFIDDGKTSVSRKASRGVYKLRQGKLIGDSQTGTEIISIFPGYIRCGDFVGMQYPEPLSVQIYF